MPKDDPDLLQQLVEGITAGCIQAIVLSWERDAILPDLYAPGDYDLRVFASAWWKEKHYRRKSDQPATCPGRGLIRLHSNGYSLARKIVFDIAGLTVNDPVEELGQTVGKALLEPTRIYAKPIARF